jgi:hypothetical protein
LNQSLIENRHGSSTAISYVTGSTVQDAMQDSNSLIEILFENDEDRWCGS